MTKEDIRETTRGERRADQKAGRRIELTDGRGERRTGAAEKVEDEDERRDHE